MKLISKTSNPLGQETVEKIEVPAAVMPYVERYDGNGKPYIKITNKQYADAVGRQVMPLNYGSQINPLKWIWRIED